VAHLDHTDAYKEFRDLTVTGIKSHFPIVGKLQTLQLNNLEVQDGDLHSDDLRAQKEAKLKGESWAVPVVASLSLIDNKTGKAIDQKKIQLAEIPKVTRRHSYIVDGQEYQVDNQWQLKPGAYVRRKQTGELETQFNVANKSPFKINFDPAKKTFMMERGSSKSIPLYPLMKTMGVDDSTLEKQWGKDILEANKNVRGVNTALERFYRADKKNKAPSRTAAEEHFVKTMISSELRPDATQMTLGKPFKNIDGDALTRASAKMLQVHSGAPEDDRDSLVFKDLRSAGDFVHDKLTDWRTSSAIRRKAMNKLNFAKNIREVMKYDTFNETIKQSFHKNSAARVADQINPVEMLASAQQTTIMGPGGIKSEQTITDEAKFINPSHLGFLDPIKTPEGDKTGITLRLPMGVRKKGRTPYIPLYNVKTGKVEDVDPGKFLTSSVVLPDQVEWRGNKPRPVGSKVLMSAPGNALTEDRFSKADYVMRSPSQLFNVTSNLIPFVANTSGNRATYAGQHIEQAISLQHREAPLVQVGTGVQKPGIRTFEEIFGRQSGHPAPVTGTVTRVGKDSVFIRGKDGKEREVQMYDNFPLNDPKAVLHSTPLVKPGDKVSAGQSVADTNFTKNGVLAQGTNLRVAYVPFKGYNFEDGVAISESAAKKLSSVHLHKPTIKLDEKTITDPRRFQVQHPEAFTRDQYKKVGDDGVIRPGQVVYGGDPLIVATKPYQLKDRMGIGAVRRSLSGQHTDTSLRWSSDYPGEVVGVSKNKKGETTVHVRTIEPMQVGDKLSGRYGNKGIVTMVLPDTEMPRTKDGRPIQVALNPSGIPGRMNTGQVLETAAAKIAEKTGKPYIVNNFDRPNTLEQVKAELKRHKLSDEEELIDPVTGVSLGKALVGPQHMLKLTHQIDKKLSVRAGMGLPGSSDDSEKYDLNLMPGQGGKTGGQSIGSLGFNVLLAHGARANIREMQTWKSEGPDPQPDDSKRWPSQHTDVWGAIQMGTPLPVPRPTFAFRKFTDSLKAAGINIEKKGHHFQLSPLTDKQILAMSSGALPKPTDLTYAKLDKNNEPKPKPGGLFDPKLTGGHGGKKWSHMKLAEPVPNPVYEQAIQRLTGLGKKDYFNVVTGDKALDASGNVVDLGTKGAATGGTAISNLLEKIDVKKELEKSIGELNKTTLPKDFAHGAATPKIDKLVKKIKHLRMLDDMGVKPSEAFVLKNLPILPPVMRPATVLPDGNIKWADLNGLYSALAQENSQLADPVISKSLPDAGKKQLRANLYDGVRAIMGVHASKDDADKKGILQQIHGNIPKEGYFQRTLMNRRQDLSMRSVIVPEPNLGLDEVGLPAGKAMSLYRPFVVRKMVEIGAARHPLEAQKLIKEDHPTAKKALEYVTQERPVLLKRDPALHKHNVLAFKPRLVPGRAIQIHPLTVSGYNADFDGDSIDLDTPLSLRIQGQVCLRTGRELIEILSADDGNYVVATKDIEAWTYAGWRPVKTISFHEVLGKKKYRVTLRNGASFIASEDHSLMVARREMKPGELTVGTELDHAENINHPHTDCTAPRQAGAWSYEKGVAYGSFLGDGCAEIRRQGGGRVAIACKPQVERDYLMAIWRKEFPNA